MDPTIISFNDTSQPETDAWPVSYSGYFQVSIVNGVNPEPRGQSPFC